MNRFFVFGLQDDLLGESLNLLIEGKTDMIEITTLLSDNIKTYHKPRKVFHVDEFVQTENGKVNRMKTINKLTTK